MNQYYVRPSLPVAYSGTDGKVYIINMTHFFIFIYFKIKYCYVCCVLEFRTNFLKNIIVLVSSKVSTRQTGPTCVCHWFLFKLSVVFFFIYICNKTVNTEHLTNASIFECRKEFY